MAKLLFFDIDGTLVDDDGNIPESTIKALSAVRKNGHLTFINTGRTWGNVDPYLRALQFDGYVCGCGTELRYQDKVLFYQTVEKPLCEKMAELVRRCHATPLYERTDTMFFDPTMPELPEYRKLMNLYERKHTAVQDMTACENFSFDKFVIWYDQHTDMELFCKETAPYFTYIDRGAGFAEMVPCNCSKGKGIVMLTELLGAKQEDTIGFGDSLNDLAMMEAVHISVAMGNGVKLFPYVTMITEDIQADGIYHALNRLQLL